MGEVSVAHQVFTITPAPRSPSVSVVDQVYTVTPSSDPGINISVSETPFTITPAQEVGVNITVAQTTHTISAAPVGIQGAQGPQGEPGTGDKHYSLPFTNSSTVIVPHNLGKRPAVTVIDSAGDEVEGGPIEHTSVNQFSVSFSAPFSGTVICN